jgi:TM2 domain-containing membrane protein YozV
MSDESFSKNLDKILYNKNIENIFLSIGSFFIGAGVILLLIEYDNCYCYCKI